MAELEDEDEVMLRSVALKNARSILLARQDAEEALRKQSDWLRTTLASIGDAVISTDSEGRVTYLNGVAAVMTGWTPAEAAGLPLDQVFRIVDEKTRQVVENPADKVFRLGTIVGLANHTILVAKDGTERPIDDSAAPIKDDGGAITGVVLVFHDVTERRAAEHALAESEEFNRRVIESSTDCLKVLDLDGRLLSMNAFGCSLMEIDDIASCLSDEWIEFWPELGRPKARSALDRAKVGLSTSFQGFCPTAKGTGRWWDVVVSPVLDAGGSPQRILVVSRDITDRRETEEATRRRASQLQRLAGISIRISSALDIDTVMSIVTEEARDLIGAHQSVIGFTIDSSWAQSINHVSLSDKYAAWRLYDTKPDGSGIYSLVCHLNRPMRKTQAELEQHPAWKHFGRASEEHPPMRGWLAAPLTGRDGTNLGLVQLSDKFDGDFTGDDEAILVQLAQMASVAIENARLYQELRSNDERKDEFLAMLAHELRNPLAAIGNAVRLTMRTSEKDHIDWSMEVIARQTRHLSRLIDDLLDVSRINRGKIELRREVMDVTPILESAAATVMTLVDERKHSLELEIDRGTLWANVDPTRLEQVVVNLLNNAAKYSEDAGHILLAARAEAGDIVIIVKDRGVGIPPEKIQGMFELFAQGDRSLARSEGGLGIGLTVVKKLVEMHGGSVAAKSEGLGTGSEFTIRLPAATKPAVARGMPTRSSEPAGKRARILVVDDNVDTARGMARILKLIGHEVATAHDGLEAIEAARGLAPDFILLDIGLPGMNGYQVASSLRKEAYCKDAVIVAISGYGQDEDRRRSKEAGFDHHLVKPLDHDALLALLATGRHGKP